MDIMSSTAEAPAKDVSFDATRLERLSEFVRAEAHKPLRQKGALDLLAEFGRERLSWPRRVARAFRRVLESEQPVLLPDERIVFTRTTTHLPALYDDAGWKSLTNGRTLHELGPISNICADWGSVLQDGLLERRRRAVDAHARADGDRAREFLECAIETIDAVLDLASRYAIAAGARGLDDTASVLERVPAHPSRSFREALQSLRFLHAAVWLEGHYHVGLGRFDQWTPAFPFDAR